MDFISSLCYLYFILLPINYDWINRKLRLTHANEVPTQTEDDENGIFLRTSLLAFGLTWRVFSISDFKHYRLHLILSV